MKLETFESSDLLQFGFAKGVQHGSAAQTPTALLVLLCMLYLVTFVASLAYLSGRRMRSSSEFESQVLHWLMIMANARPAESRPQPEILQQPVAPVESPVAAPPMAQSVNGGHM